MKQRILKLELVRVGFSSIGLDPGSMAYTSAMHGSGDRLLRDPRPERSLLGAFSAGTAPAWTQPTGQRWRAWPDVG